MDHIVLFVLAASLGIVTQSFAGFAGALTAVPLFTLFMSPKEAIPPFNVVSTLINAWLVFQARQHLEWCRIAILLLGACVGVPLGAWALDYFSVPMLRVSICVITCGCALLFLLNIRIPLGDSVPTQLLIGLTSGVLCGSISMPGPPIVIYGLARGWDKNTFRSSCLTYFMCVYLEVIGTHWAHGLLSTSHLVPAAAAVIPGFTAAVIGIQLKDRVSEAAFRRGILVIIIVVSIISVSMYL